MANVITGSTSAFGADALWQEDKTDAGYTIADIADRAIALYANEIDKQFKFINQAVNAELALNALSVSGNVNFGGDLDLSSSLGVLTTNFLTASNATITNLNLTNVFASGVVSASLGLSGSLTRLIDGTSYLVEGTNITITSSSNGQVIISSTAATSADADWTEDSATELSTTSSVYINKPSPSDIGLSVSGSVFFSGSLNVDGGVDLEHVITGNVRFIDDVFISGSGYFENNVAITGTLNSTDINNVGHIFNTGSAYISGDAAITGSVNVSQDATIVGDVHATGSLYVQTNAAITGTLDTTGKARFVDDVLITGSLYVGTDVAITGSLNSTGINNDGTLDQTGDIVATGDLALIGDFVETGAAFHNGLVDVQGYVAMETGTVSGSILNVAGPTELTGATADLRHLDFYIGAPIVRYYTNSGSLVLSSSNATFDKMVMFLIDSTTGSSTVSLDADDYRVVGGGTYDATSGTVNVFSCYCRNVSPTIIDVAISSEASGSGGLITGK